MAVTSQCVTDRWEIAHLILQCLGGPLPGSERNPARCAVGNNVNRGKLFAAFERGCHLPRSWRPRIEHDSADLGPKVSKNCLEIGNGRIHEEKFCLPAHLKFLSVPLH
jgi:hypothetical protein